MNRFEIETFANISELKQGDTFSVEGLKVTKSGRLMIDSKDVRKPPAVFKVRHPVTFPESKQSTVSKED